MVAQKREQLRTVTRTALTLKRHRHYDSKSHSRNRGNQPRSIFAFVANRKQGPTGPAASGNSWALVIDKPVLDLISVGSTHTNPKR